MILDIEMLRSFYASYSDSVKQAKATVKRPLTYAEKLLCFVFGECSTS